MVLPTDAWENSAPALSAGVPLLVGNVRDEFKLSSMVFDPVRLKGLAERIYGPGFPRLLQALEQDFPNLSANEKAGILSGIQFHNAAVDQALLKAAQGSAPVYSYWFTYNPPKVLDGRIGAPHCADIAYFFDNAARAEQQTGNTAEANRLAAVMSEALVRFAAVGSPSQPGLRWPTFTASRRETMVFNARSRVELYPGRNLFEMARDGA